jgi:hypothetical protein
MSRKEITRVIHQQDEKFTVLVATISNLDSTIFDQFEQNTERILSLIGPRAIENVNEAAVHEAKISEYLEEIEKILNDRAEIVSICNSLNSAIFTLESRLIDKSHALIEAQKRSALLKGMNDLNIEAMNNVPSQTIEVETKETGWWFWRKRCTTYQRVQNTNRKSELDHYEDLIARRNKQLREYAEEEAEIEEVKVSITYDLNEQKKLLTRKTEELARYNEGGMLYDRIVELEIKVIEERDNVKQILSQYKNTVEDWGIEGKVLMDFATRMKSMGPLQKENVGMVKPLLTFVNLLQVKIGHYLNIIMNREANLTDVRTSANELLLLMGTIIPPLDSMNSQIKSLKENQQKMLTQ